MPFLEMKQVCKSYTQGAKTHSVLKDVSLAIEEGEFVALVGFSGSGKTTLMSTLAGSDHAGFRRGAVQGTSR